MTASARSITTFQPEIAQAARDAAQAAREAAQTARADAALDQARAAVDRATAQDVARALPGDATQITTSADGRRTTIVDGAGNRTVISVDEEGRTTIQQGTAPPATLAPGPWSESIRQLAEAANRRHEAFTVADAAPPFPPRDDFPEQIIPLVGMTFGLIASTIVLFPIARAFGRRIDRKTVAAAPIPSDLGARFDRIEQAIETMAVEVERVSEAHRYSARLLTERLPESAARALTADHAR